jgi:hypothetical protein
MTTTLLHENKTQQRTKAAKLTLFPHVFDALVVAGEGCELRGRYSEGDYTSSEQMNDDVHFG